MASRRLCEIDQGEGKAENCLYLNHYVLGDHSSQGKCVDSPVSARQATLFNINFTRRGSVTEVMHVNFYFQRKKKL